MRPVANRLSTIAWLLEPREAHEMSAKCAPLRINDILAVLPHIYSDPWIRLAIGRRQNRRGFANCKRSAMSSNTSSNLSQSQP